MKAADNERNQIELNDNESPNFSPIEIQQSGGVMRVTLVTIGKEEGLTTGQAAKLFNIGEGTIRKHIIRHDISTGQIVLCMLQLLKNNGVIHQKASHAIFIPRYGLRELMRVIGTDEAKAAYHQLFDDAEELFRIKPLYDAQEKLLKEKDQKIDQFSHKIAKIEGENRNLRKSNEDLKATVDAFERHIK